MTPETSDKTAGSGENTVVRSAFKVGLGGLFTLIAGLVSQVIVASIFGAGAEMDAFLTALVVPVYLQAVLLAGLPFVLIPAFVQEEAVGREEEAWALTGTFFWLTGGILALIAVGGSLLAPRIIALTAPGLSPEKAFLATQMLRVLMFAVPLTGLGSLTKGIQNARDRFFWPAVASAIGSVGNVTILVILFRAVGPLALAWGYLGSVAVQACVTVIPVLRRGWKGLIPLGDKRLIEMARLIAPFVLFGVLTRSTSVFERYFASGLPDGNLSYLGYAQRISGIVMTVLGSAIATAAFPAMARAYAHKGEIGLVEKAEYGFRLTLAVGLPVLAIFSAIAVPLVAVLYERGAFEHTATLSVSRIVPMVIISNVLCGMLGYVIGRTFYVTRDTDTVPIVGAATSVLYILLAKVLVGAWGYVGLAFAAVLQDILAVSALSLLLVRRLRAFHRGALLKHGLAYAGASLAAFLAARLTSGALSSLPALVQLVTASLVAGTVYMAILFAMDKDIAMALLEMTGVQRIATGAKVVFHRARESTL